jgi:hypothetical protein
MTKDLTGGSLLKIDTSVVCDSLVKSAVLSACDMDMVAV